jgi:hypothetical protein
MFGGQPNPYFFFAAAKSSCGAHACYAYIVRVINPISPHGSLAVRSGNNIRVPYILAVS